MQAPRGQAARPPARAWPSPAWTNAQPATPQCRCGHCKRLEPVWNQLADKVEADATLRGRVLVAKVDADAHRELATRFGVGGYPTINYFGRGKPVTSPEK